MLFDDGPEHSLGERLRVLLQLLLTVAQGEVDGHGSPSLGVSGSADPTRGHPSTASGLGSGSWPLFAWRGRSRDTSPPHDRNAGRTTVVGYVFPGVGGLDEALARTEAMGTHSLPHGQEMMSFDSASQAVRTRRWASRGTATRRPFGVYGDPILHRLALAAAIGTMPAARVSGAGGWQADFR